MCMKDEIILFRLLAISLSFSIVFPKENRTNSIQWRKCFDISNHHSYTLK